MFGKKRLSLEDMGVEVDQDPILSNTPEVEESTTPVVVEEVEQAGDKDARIAQLEAQVAELQEKLGNEDNASSLVVGTDEENNVESELSTEGFLGGLTGFFALPMVQMIPIIGLVAAPALAAQVNVKEKELKNLTKELRTLVLDKGKQAVADGKLEPEDYKKITSVDGSALAWGFLGGFLGPIYGAIKGSELQDILNEIKKKEEELEETLRAIRAEAMKKK